MANQRQRILIYHQACIGDLLMALPAMQAIRQFYPEAQIDLLAVSAVPGSIQKTLIEPLNLFEKNDIPGNVWKFLSTFAAKNKNHKGHALCK